MARPTIKKIMLEIDGRGPVEIDPTETAALFFTDFAVKDILSNYYKSVGDNAKATGVVDDWDKISPDALGIIKRPNCTYEVIP